MPSPFSAVRASRFVTLGAIARRIQRAGRSIGSGLNVPPEPYLGRRYIDLSTSGGPSSSAELLVLLPYGTGWGQEAFGKRNPAGFGCLPFQ